MLENKDISHDLFLGGKVKAFQPIQGYRAAIDPVLLAAATQVKPNQKVLDVGAGVGVASLCLAQRDPYCQICGIEIQTELVKLADQNIVLNGHSGRVHIIEGDLKSPPEHLISKKFDAVMTNPPYYEADKTRVSPHAQKATAHVESVELKDWLNFCVHVLKPKGTLTLIHTAERMDEILCLLRQKMGDIVVFPLWPTQGKPARRVIIRARKGIKSKTQFSHGLTLHTPQGQFTPEAEEILRLGKSLAY